MLSPLLYASATGSAHARPWGQNAHPHATPPHATQHKGNSPLRRSIPALSRTTGNLPPNRRAAETPKQDSNLPLVRAG